MKRAKIAQMLRVEPGSKFRLSEYQTDYSDSRALRHLSGDELKEEAKRQIEKNLRLLSESQELLYANGRVALLLIFQAMDAAGKDGMIKHVMSGINPQGCQVHSFKKPSEEELQHDFLWRCSKCLPPRGYIGIFNRSYYEEVLILKVHPELLAAQKLPDRKTDRKFWENRYEDINGFERHLVRNGTVILKFFLNISKKEQKKRFLDRLNDPAKYWKFSSADLTEREFWPDYMDAYEKAIRATSTKWAPWYVIPADHKWVARAAVSGIISHTIESLRLTPPEVSSAKLKDLAKARNLLTQAK